MWVVFSDLHDNLANLDTCFNWCQKHQIKQAIFCGDLTNLDTFNYLINRWDGSFYFIQGNADNYDTSDLPSLNRLHNLGRYGRFQIDQRTIGLCHEPSYQRRVLADGPVDVLFFGHTHQPWQEQQDNTWLVNPGTLGGIYYPASFAIYDAENNVWQLKTLQQLTD